MPYVTLLPEPAVSLSKPPALFVECHCSYACETCEGAGAGPFSLCERCMEDRQKGRECAARHRRLCHCLRRMSMRVKSSPCLFVLFSLPLRVCIFPSPVRAYIPSAVCPQRPSCGSHLRDRSARHLPLRQAATRLRTLGERRTQRLVEVAAAAQGADGVVASLTWMCGWSLCCRSWWSGQQSGTAAGDSNAGTAASRAGRATERGGVSSVRREAGTTSEPPPPSATVDDDDDDGWWSAGLFDNPEQKRLGQQQPRRKK